MLHERGNHDLPKTARTLLGTKTVGQLRDISGGQYHYIGFESACNNLLTANPWLEKIRLVMNIDGLLISISGSLSTYLWPILCKAFDIPNPDVFPVALCVTAAKPKDLSFLDETLNEIKRLLINGFKFSSRTVPVELFQVVCDAPAKAMCKGAKSFSGYYGCDKCETRGTYLHRYQKITFPEIKNPILRTNESFRTKTNPEHHIATTPFIDIPNFDMINAFPIYYMHQVLLGVQRRLLNIWVNEKKGLGSLNTNSFNVINDRLSKLPNQARKELACKPRSLKHLPHFKATEFRSFLLYTGKVVLKNMLSTDQYTHFQLP